MSRGGRCLPQGRPRRLLRLRPHSLRSKATVSPTPRTRESPQDRWGRTLPGSHGNQPVPGSRPPCGSRRNSYTWDPTANPAGLAQSGWGLGSGKGRPPPSLVADEGLERPRASAAAPSGSRKGLGSRCVLHEPQRGPRASNRGTDTRWTSPNGCDLVTSGFQAPPPSLRPPPGAALPGLLLWRELWEPTESGCCARGRGRRGEDVGPGR